MPIYKYRGYTPGGAESAGTVEAEGARDAVSKVRALGLYPRDIELTGREQKWWKFKRPEADRLPEVTRQLSVLLAAGVPLVEAIRAMSRESRGRWKSLLVEIREKVAGGSSLSRAMEDHEDIFPEFFRNMVAAGEQSGALDRVLEQLSGFLESQSATKSKVRTAMVYPTIMACVGFFVLAFLFTFVVPKIVKIFEDTQSALPLPTVILMAVSGFFVHYWWVVVALASGGLYGGRKLVRKHRLALDRLLMRVFESLYLSRFARTLGFLLGGGLPMLRSLELAGRTTGNLWLNGLVTEAGLKVAEGARLSASLEGLPPVLLELVSTGERSGRLVEVLSRAAATYESDFDRKVQRALALLGPVMVLLMGLVVLFIVLAVLLPMFQLNQLIK